MYGHHHEVENKNDYEEQDMKKCKNTLLGKSKQNSVGVQCTATTLHALCDTVHCTAATALAVWFPGVEYIVCSV